MRRSMGAHAARASERAGERVKLAVDWQIGFGVARWERETSPPRREIKSTKTIECAISISASFEQFDDASGQCNDSNDQLKWWTLPSLLITWKTMSIDIEIFRRGKQGKSSSSLPCCLVLWSPFRRRITFCYEILLRAREKRDLSSLQSRTELNSRTK